jgi:hypothetical protein
VILHPHSLNNSTDKFRVVEFRDVVDSNQPPRVLGQWSTYIEAEMHRDEINDGKRSELLGLNDAVTVTVTVGKTTREVDVRADLVEGWDRDTVQDVAVKQVSRTFCEAYGIEAERTGRWQSKRYVKRTS